MRELDSLGALALASGSASVGADDAVLTISNLPPNQFAIAFASTGSNTVAFGDGLFCGSGGVQIRYPVQNAGALGVIVQGNLASLAGLAPGQSIRFQGWYRDPQGPCGSAVNLSSGIIASFVP